MKTVGEIMTAEVVWINSSTSIKTAVVLMKAHNIGALPVVDPKGAVLGLITLADLLGESEDAKVAQIMNTDYPAVDPETNVYDAAELLIARNATHLLVMSENNLAGIISRSDIIPELGKTYDPLTGLPWSDSFREWATNALKRGVEISMILFDLDKFGQYNKEHSHIVGDRVIKEVARTIKEAIDTNTDFACRYAGDEFAIVSTRHADEAAILAVEIQRRIREIKLEGVPVSISATYGLAGGRRTKERLEVHYASTLDNLITRASKECIAHKPGKREEPTEPEKMEEAKPVAPKAAEVPTSTGRLRIGNITYSSSGSEASVSVKLIKGDEEYSREVSGFAIDSLSALRLVAEAAAVAACKSLAPEHGIVIEDIGLYDIAGDDEMVTVVAGYITPRWTAKLAGSAVVRRGDQFRAAAAALLSAVNRLLEITPPI